MNSASIQSRLQKLGKPEKAAFLQRFFKTGPGQYGHGDVFLGLTVPQLRKLSSEYHELPLDSISQLIKSRFHEVRLLALLILVRRYSKGDERTKRNVYDFYLAHIEFINNWDLVDLSAPQIVGDFLLHRSRKPIYAWAKSRNLWKRRIAIISTLRFIREGDLKDTLEISKALLSDTEDLIHKAVGWMLREVGKRHLETEEKFLKDHYHEMPRTMLRYAIERFPEARRMKYLRGTI